MFSYLYGMRLLFACLFLLFYISLWGQRFSERKIGKMIQEIPALEQAHVAIIIEPLNTSKPKAFYQGDYYMTPASNTKLLTYLAAVQTFDSLPAVFFHQQDSIMHFKATGYPLLYHPFYPDPDLTSFFDQKYSWQYHPTRAKPHPHGSGWSWDDYAYYYAAETSPFPIHGNTLELIGSPTNFQFTPQAFEMEMVLDSRSKKLHRKKSHNRFYFNPNKLSEKDTLYHPFITSDSLFVRLLQEQINHPVSLLEASKPEIHWEVLNSKQEAMLYKALLQESDNGVAEALLNMIALSQFDEMDVPKAIDSLKSKWKSWLPDPIEWVDGSGISRYNMITPRTLIAVLKKIHQKVGPDTIKDYFPKSASSGTLKDHTIKNVYAKTGTLKHNHNLSGFWFSPKGNAYVFSIMVNHYTAPTGEIRAAISELIRQFQKKLK